MTDWIPELKTAIEWWKTAPQPKTLASQDEAMVAFLSESYRGMHVIPSSRHVWVGEMYLSLPNQWLRFTYQDARSRILFQRARKAGATGYSAVIGWAEQIYKDKEDEWASRRNASIESFNALTPEEQDEIVSQQWQHRFGAEIYEWTKKYEESGSQLDKATWVKNTLKDEAMGGPFVLFHPDDWGMKVYNE